jgi:hypothetical protein
VSGQGFTVDDEILLLPRPRRMERLPGPGAPIETPPSEALDDSLAPQHYRLRISEGTVELHHADEAGRRYGRETLRQLGHGRERLPSLRIEDGPDFPVRGYMLDVSRDRVPTRETLERIVEVLELFRINHFELYTEHTFAYREHETVWREASPITPEDLRWLDALCAERDIALVGNQNTFGHMGRWLKHPDYEGRAEAPDGYTTKLGLHLSPGVLEPTDDNANFALSLCRELLQNLRERRINIGCDETFELGKGKSRKLVEAEGTERVYLEHLLRLVRGLRADGVEVSFWGDILRHRPELAAELPRDGVTALAWHYEAPMDPDDLPAPLFELLSEFGITRDTLRGFDGHVAGFVEAGLPFWVCPGTSSWNTLVGRLDNARGNLLDAARVGLARGAGGYLITDWGDNGHMQPPSVSWPALAYGASVAWCAETNHELDVSAALDAWVFGDEARVLGSLLDRIGHLHGGTGKVGMNGSPLFTELLARGGLLGSMGEANAPGTARTLDDVEAALEDLTTARPTCADGATVCAELEAALRLARHGAWRIARAAGLPAPGDAELAADLREAIGLQEAAWHARARHGGWPDSLARLEATLASYDT